MIYPSGALTIKFIMFQVHFKKGQSSVLLAWQLQRFYPAWFLRKLKISCNKSTNDPSNLWHTFYISQCSSSSLDNYKCARYPTLRDSKLNCRGCFPRRTDGTISGDDPKFRYEKSSLQMWLLCHSNLRNSYVALFRSNFRSSIPQRSKLRHCQKSRMVPKPYRQYQFPK